MSSKYTPAWCVHCIIPVVKHITRSYLHGLLQSVMLGGLEEAQELLGGEAAQEVQLKLVELRFQEQDGVWTTDFSESRTKERKEELKRRSGDVQE